LEGALRLKNLVIICIIIFLSVGCSKPEVIEIKEPEEITIEEGNSDNEDEKNSVFIGDEAYFFSVEDNSGNQLKLEDYLGSKIILNFWVTWNKASEVQNEVINELYQLEQDQFKIISINATAFEQENLEYVIKHHQYKFPIYFDFEGEIIKNYMVRTFPTTYVIDEKGTIQAIYTSSVTKEKILEMINPEEVIERNGD